MQASSCEILETRANTQTFLLSSAPRDCVCKLKPCGYILLDYSVSHSGVIRHVWFGCFRSIVQKKHDYKMGIVVSQRWIVVIIPLAVNVFSQVS